MKNMTCSHITSVASNDTKSVTIRVDVTTHLTNQRNRCNAFSDLPSGRWSKAKAKRAVLRKKTLVDCDNGRTKLASERGVPVVILIGLAI